MAAPGGLAATVHTPRSEQDLRISRDHRRSMRATGVGLVGGMLGPVEVDVLASTRIGWIGLVWLDWPSAEATGDSPGGKKQRPSTSGSHTPGTLLQAAGPPRAPS
jgi:hypothetical protein